jgi:hypothetical protein
MSRLAKVGVVSAGYVAAIAAAFVAAQLYNARVSALPYDTSGGMYAGGEMLSAIAAFLVVALVPTLLALWYLRGHERFWDAVAILSLAFAAVGLVAVLSPAVTHGTTQRPGFLILSLMGLAQLLGAPFWATAFVLFAVLAPTRRTRGQLIVALGIELVIGACALVHWFVPGSPL